MSHSGIRPPRRSWHERARAITTLDGDPLRTRDGSELILRPIHADDYVALQRGFRHLSADEVRMRFLHPLTELPEPLARQLCDLDPKTAVAFVLIDPPSVTEPEVHAVARAYLDPVTLSAEFAVVVQSRYTGQGLGHLLVRRVIAACRALGAIEMWGNVLLDNDAMLKLCDRIGCERHSQSQDPGVARVTLDLTRS